MAKLVIPQDQLVLIRRLREAGILNDVQENSIELAQGAVVCDCPDCDQTPDSRGFLSGLGQRGSVRLHHTPGLNGGPLVIPPESVLNSEIQQSAVAIKNIRDALLLKGLDRTIVLVAHAPCGAATHNKMDLVLVLNMTMRAKEILKGEFPRHKVPVLFHVDYTNQHANDITGPIPDGKRTYYLSTKKWKGSEFGS